MIWSQVLSFYFNKAVIINEVMLILLLLANIQIAGIFSSHNF